MNLTIWKYEIEIRDKQLVMMPNDAKLLTVQMQNGKPCIWAMVDPNKPQFPRTIKMAGTGHDLSEKILGDYIGTIQDGPFVWHYFDGIA